MIKMLIALRRFFNYWITFLSNHSIDNSKKDKHNYSNQPGLIPLWKANSEIPTGDVIFVHGMAGGPYETWNVSEGNQNIHWAKWLAEVRPDLNFWTLAYPASPSQWKGTALPLQYRATNILALLKTRGIGKRPVCFIAHSLGGLLVKQMLHTSIDGGTKEYNYIGKSVRGVVFLSTHHTGADLATLVRYLRFIFRSSVVIEDMTADAPILMELNIWYLNKFEELGIKNKVFFENWPTFGFIVVDVSSGALIARGERPIGIDADHITICKPVNKYSLVYASTRDFVNEVIPPSGNNNDRESALWGELILAKTGEDIARVQDKAEDLFRSAPNKSDLNRLRRLTRDATKYGTIFIICVALSSLLFSRPRAAVVNFLREQLNRIGLLKPSPAPSPVPSPSPLSTPASIPTPTPIPTGILRRTARVWNADTHKPLFTVSRGDVTSAAFSPDSEQVVTGDTDGTIRTWNVKTHKPTAEFQSKGGAVISVAFGSNAKEVITVEADGIVRVWNIKSRTTIAEFSRSMREIKAASFSPDLKRVVIAGTGNEVRVLDLKNRKLVAEIPAKGEAVRSLAFSPDSNQVVTIEIDGVARIWNVSPKKLIATLPGERGAVMNVAFSPNFRWIVTAEKDSEANILNAQTRKKLTTLPGNKGEVWAATFSPDSMQVVTAGTGNIAYIWKPFSKSQPFRLQGHKHSVLNAFFSPSGKLIITIGEDE